MNSSLLVNEIQEGKWDEKLLSVYVDHSMLESQKSRYIQLIRDFENKFGEGEIEVYSVPGRSEVAGNHTDHQHGCVLACAVNLDIVVVARKSDQFSLISNNRPIEGVDASALSYREAEKKTSKALVKGVMNRLKNMGYKVGNFQAIMVSNVLVGSGLSSSAAFEVAVAKIISELYNEGRITPVEMAISSQYAENVYFGKPSGLMDQMACACGSLVFIDFKEVTKPVVEKLDVDFTAFNHSLCIINTMGSHSDLNEDYAAIPVEMRSVANFFGKDYLRDVTVDQILDNLAAVRKRCGDRAVLRALHMLEEDDRVLQQVENLKKGDFEAFKKGITASGDSSYKYLQNVYTTHNNMDQSLALAIKLSEMILKDKGVVRVHGGGFAGTIQAFVEDDFVEEYRQKIERYFGEGTCLVLKINPFGAYKVM